MSNLPTLSDNSIGQSLNIALVAPLVAPVGPPFLGGAQAMLHDLAVGLAQRGHQVTVFAASGSRFEDNSPRPAAGTLRLDQVAVSPGELSPADFNSQENGAARPAFYRQGELFLEIFLKINRANPSFDLAHAHAFDWPAFVCAPLSAVPVVHTIHLPSVDPYINALVGTVYRQTGRSQAVTVSRTCAATYAADFAFDRVIYNGINSAAIPFGSQGQGFLLFAGRMAPEKGADLAIAIARRAGRPLVLAGGIYDQAFFDSQIAPELAAHPEMLRYTGQLGRPELYRLMSQADALLFPSRWEEPFGLVLAESLAAGTPVVAWRRGAAPEIIIEGQTGFLLDFEDIDGAARALDRLEQLDRAGCRRHVEENFSLEAMLTAYEQYYLEIVDQNRKRG